MSGISRPTPSEGRTIGAGVGAGTTGRGAEGRLVAAGVLQELEAGAGLEVAADLLTADVQPRLELPTGVGPLDGVEDGVPHGRDDCAEGARRSANFPRPGPEGVILEESDGTGMRVSIRRMSWTLENIFNFSCQGKKQVAEEMNTNLR